MNIKEQLVYFSRLCYDNKYLSATDGNLSIRAGTSKVIVTASNTVKGKLTLSQLVMVNINGEKLSGSGKPTNELKLHLYIYKKRNDIKAVIHSHPHFCTAFAIAGITLDKITLPEVYLKAGKIPLAPYGTPHTGELPASIEKYVMNYNAVLLSNHGLVTYGSSLEEAYYLTEKAEQFAEISFYACILGGERELTKQQQNKLNKIKN